MQRPRRRSRERRRAARDNIIGALLLAVAMMAVAAGVAAYAYLRGQARPLEAQTLCPKDGPDQVTVVLLDVTDPLNAAQRQGLQNEFIALRDRLPPHARLEVYTVGDTDGTLLTPVAALCNPGRGSDIDWLRGNPGRVEKRWREAFEVPLNAALEAALQAPTAQRSPILESIQSVSLTSLLLPAHRDRPRSLIVVSDLLQHTDGLTFYRGLPTADRLISLPAFARLRADLRNVKVELWLVRREAEASRQGRALIELWQGIFAAQGAEVIRVYALAG